MAYSESKELTDTEKRLQSLKIQLFGKERHATTVSHKSNIINSSSTTISYQHHDLTYLKKDLQKILILATIAFSVQLILYLQFTFKIVRFN